MLKNLMRVCVCVCVCGVVTVLCRSKGKHILCNSPGRTAGCQLYLWLL